MKHFKKYFVSVTIVLVAVLILQILYGLMIYERILHSKQRWTQYNNIALKFNAKLYELKSHFGYGGFIHHFKNLVLRKDVYFIPLIDSEIKIILKQIKSFENLQLTSEERSALSNIKNTIEEYQFKYLHIRDINLKNISEKQIDAIVKVDDSRAFHAFNILEQSRIKRNTNHLEVTEKALETTTLIIQGGFFFLILTIVKGFIIIYNLRKKDIVNTKLDETLKYFNSIVEMAPDAIITSNSSGNILLANKQAVNLFGYTKNEFSSLTIEDLTPHEYRHHHTYLRKDYLKEPGIREMNRGLEIFALHKNSDKIPVSIGLNTIELNGSQIVIAIIRNLTQQKQIENKFKLLMSDISEHKIIELELKNAKELAESAAKAKSEFLANMSHEIRTPLNAILGMNHLLQTTKLDLRQKDYSNKIDKSAKNLLGIINDILDFSKIEAGKLTIENIPFNLDELMMNLVSLFELKIKEKNLELVISVEQDVPLNLIGDPLRITQILTNLTSNAIKFTEQGEVIINIQLDEQIDKDDIVITFSIKDTGIGLSKEQQNILFQSFTQADSSITRKYGGTGLGLAISHRLVSLMGGKIYVESELGKGSHFSFTAKLGIQQYTKNNFTLINKKINQLKVLVVDDSDLTRKILTRYLKSFIKKIKDVDSGYKAINELKLTNNNRKDKYDLVIIDWKMPDMDGFKTIEMIQNTEDITHIPKIILITGWSYEDMVNQAQNVKIDAFLIKPIHQSTLFDTIMTIFSHYIPNKTEFDIENITHSGLHNIRGAKILLVEDNEINQQVAKEILEHENFRVTVAKNGQKAINILTQVSDTQNFDLVLMDLQMPILDGYKASQQIREDLKLLELPIIAMTADVMEGVKESVYQSGMNDYITKPIDPQKLFESIVKWVKPGIRENFYPGEQLVHTNNTKDHKEFPFLDGIDIQIGLKRVYQNTKLYKRLLIQFKQKNGLFLEELQQMIKDGSHKDLKLLLHTIKGIAGNLGAMDLHQTIYNMEIEIQANFRPENLESHFQDIQKNLNRVFTSIRLLEQEEINTYQENKSVDMQQITELLDQFSKHLKDYNLEASHIYEQLQEILKNTHISNYINSIEDSIRSYNYEKALEKLPEIKEQLSKV